MTAPGAGEIGEFLRNARERQKRYSQEQAAVLTGTSSRSLRSWERGEVAPAVDQFFRLVVLYGAREALVNHVRVWLDAPRQSQGKNGDRPDQPGNVPREKATPAERAKMAEAERDYERTLGKKAGSKKRPA